MTDTFETLEYHPLANLFPLLEGNQFKKLKHDILHNGKLEPIVLFEGKILDGRNRYRACVDLGLEPKTEELESLNAADFVNSKNILRRHLTTSQRSAIAA